MEIVFQNIEKETDESLLLQTEVLLDQQAVLKLNQTERHFWLADVADNGETYEVELKTAPGRIKVATCDCTAFRQKGICAHILAATLLIRKEQTQVPKTKPKTSKKNLNKLTTPLILEEVSQEELKEFIRLYARKNRNFDLALKAHFAPAVSRLNSAEKYLDLIEATLVLARKPDRTFSTRGGHTVEKHVAELLQQAKETLQLKDYNETWLILQSLVIKIPPILNKSGESKEKLFDLILEAFTLIHSLTRQSVAPMLKTAIWDFALQESQKIVYRNHGFDISLFQVLDALRDEDEKTEILSGLILRQLNIYEEENRSFHALIFQYIAVADSSRHATLLRHSYPNAASIIPAVELALLSQHPDKGKILVDFALTLEPSAVQIRQLTELHIRLARELQDPALEISLLSQELTRNFDFSYYRRIKETAQYEQYWKADPVLDVLKKNAGDEQAKDCVAAILAAEGQDESLLEWIRSCSSIDILMNHDHHLLPLHKQAVRELYEQWLTSFLDAHIGPVPSKKIGRIIQHLKAIEADSLVTHLIEYFKQNYPLRHTLMEELAIYDAYED